MSPIRIQRTVSRCMRATRKTTTDATYLIDCNIVTRLLKSGGVVVLVPHDNPHLVENNSTDQLVGALDLHHNGHDVVRGLEKRNKSTVLGCVVGGFIFYSILVSVIKSLAGHSKPRIASKCVFVRVWATSA